MPPRRVPNQYQSYQHSARSTYLPPPRPYQPYSQPAVTRTYPNVMRPVNSQNRSFRPPAASKFQGRPVLGTPLHLRHDVERVVYKKPEPTAAQSTPTPSQSSLNVCKSATPQLQSNLGPERVIYKPTTTSLPLNLGAERVVYKPNAPTPLPSTLSSEKEVYKVEETQEIGVKQSNAWTEARSVVAEEYNSSTLSENGSSYTSFTESIDSLEDCENENDGIETVLRDRKVSYDEGNAAKITITVNNCEQPLKKAPVDIRNELSALRKRLARLDLTKNIMQDEGFITSAEIQIPLPNLSTNPMWFDIKILRIESPHKFTFQYDFPAIEILQDRMKEFYEAIADSPTYIAKNLAIDMVVAVLHSNKWYRAQVKSFDDIIAEIIPLDCMTLKPKKVARNSIFYLHKKFIEDTQKSAVGRVFGIKPLGNEGEWSEAVNAEMANLALERHLATVKIANDNLYHLSIIANDTSRLRIIDIFIEKNLVKLEAECFNVNGPAMKINMSLK